MKRGRVAAALVAAALVLGLTACAPTATATTSGSGDYVVISITGSGDIAGQVGADGVLTLAGSCVGIDVGDGPVLGVFPPSTTVTDDGSVRFAGGAEWRQDAAISATGSASAFDELDADIASIVPENCITEQVFFVTDPS